MDYKEINPQIDYFINRRSTPNWMIEDATTNFIDLTYFTNGKALYQVNDEYVEVNQGDLICIPQDSRRSATTDANNPIESFAVNFQLYDIKGNHVELPFPLVSHIGFSEELLSLYNELTLVWLKKVPGFEIKARALLLMILHQYFNRFYYRVHVQNVDSRIQKSITYILNNLHHPIKVDELAHIAGVTTAYYGTLFKKYTGSSVKEYINKMKISNAENILLSGEFSVRDAAYKCGFEDTFYFSKLFKKIKGYPPSKILLDKKMTALIIPQPNRCSTQE
ncbi:AraC family transcriptional regulator [Paenibacillus polysaccharolyticus]|uniref:helix-turn-helix domain-containing protein n=1 Tax=Paenibacillus polysaccharolyticus TaxID=582692 RepID=UPI0020423DE1|nr:AraC family transcriptional regulator [Paenibacillus polysaccharolyticus]MCM3135726.1 AraC family transcriptional regulator [Paenibacillus polysaccharolyticus]